MKAITLSQPFASLVAVGAKTIVTRPGPTAYRGSLAVHAARTPMIIIDPYHRSVLASAGLDPDSLPRGAIVAECRLAECRKITTSNCPCYPEYAFSDFTLGWFAWMLSDIRIVPVPIPARGRAGLWQWRS